MEQPEDMRIDAPPLQQGEPLIQEVPEEDHPMDGEEACWPAL